MTTYSQSQPTISFYGGTTPLQGGIIHTNWFYWRLGKAYLILVSLIVFLNIAGFITALPVYDMVGRYLSVAPCQWLAWSSGLPRASHKGICKSRLVWYTLERNYPNLFPKDTHNIMFNRQLVCDTSIKQPMLQKGSDIQSPVTWQKLLANVPRALLRSLRFPARKTYKLDSTLQ